MVHSVSLVVLLLASELGAQEPPVSTDPVVEAVQAAQEALGASAFARQPQGILIRGDCRFLESDGEFELVLDAKGRFRFTIRGPLSRTTGFDGTMSWEVDWTGTPRVLELGDHESALAQVWLRSGWWLSAPQRFDLSVSEEQPAPHLLALDWKLHGGRLDGRVTLARDTGLPVSYVAESGEEDERVELGDYRTALGLQLPHRIISHQPGGKRDVFEIVSVEPAPAYLRSPFARAAALPDDFSFDNQVPAELVVRKAPSGHLLAQASVQGSEPLWFILDTGAGAMTVDRGLAEDLKMEPIGEIAAKGVGGLVDSRFVRGESITVGPVTLRNPIFLELELDFLEPYFGVEVSGILGYGLFGRTVTEIDMVEGTAALHPSDRYELTGAAWQEVILYGRHPNVRARFEGDRDGVFKLDTGAARSTVIFHAPAVQELGFLEGRELQAGSSAGVGGAAAVKTGTIDYFELSGHRFEKPEVVFGLEARGAFEDPYTAGNIGGQFLRPFRLVLDYPRKRIAFVER